LSDADEPLIKSATAQEWIWGTASQAGFFFKNQTFNSDLVLNTGQQAAWLVWPVCVCSSQVRLKLTMPTANVLRRCSDKYRQYVQATIVTVQRHSLWSCWILG
jgi:hypothetical protein